MEITERETSNILFDDDVTNLSITKKESIKHWFLGEQKIQLVRMYVHELATYLKFWKFQQEDFYRSRMEPRIRKYLYQNECHAV